MVVEENGDIGQVAVTQIDVFEGVGSEVLLKRSLSLGIMQSGKTY